jgi:hypothetical protein
LAALAFCLPDRSAGQKDAYSQWLETKWILVMAITSQIAAAQ